MLRFVPRFTGVFDQRAAAALSPYAGVTARLLYARGVASAAQADAFLHPALSQLHDPLRMSGMAEAVRLLAHAREEGLAAVVYGDYDADGACACALLTQALRRYGLSAEPYVPLREKGYGLNAEAVRALAERFRVLVTVDLGITNHEEVRLAQSLGMTVIVTDHHGLALTESPADAVLNPLLGDYPFRRLCGTGVAFKLAQALLGADCCMDFLDLAALATVADIVPLTDENRVLVALGLPVIASGARPGLRALLHTSGVPDAISAETLGFRLGPRLNAAGRLDDAAKAVALLMTDDAREAQRLAEELEALNEKRRAAEQALVRAAEEAAAKHDFIARRALIVRGENWHVGVIGLAAGRLCQKYFCPTCVLSQQDGLLHGSLRSVPGVHIHKCLQACDDLLLRYGGHEQAAGVTLRAENYDAFCERLQAAVGKADPACFVPAQEYDAEIALCDCTDALVNEVSLLAPFGCGNPPPLFLARGLAPEERRAVGADGAHLKLTLRQEKQVLGGIAFSMGALASALPDRVDAVFNLSRNTFRGVTSLQMEVKALQPERNAVLRGLAHPEGDREANALLDGMLALLALQAGKTQENTEVETVAEIPETWAALEAQFDMAEELVVAEEPATAEQSVTAGQPITERDPATAGAPAMAGQPATAEQPATAGQPITERDPATAGAPAMAGQPTTAEQPATTEEPTTSQHPALASHPSAAPRGALLVARTAASAARAFALADMDVQTRCPDDPRCFPTLLTEPNPGAVSGGWRQVWLLDGELVPGEAALWRTRLPLAQVHVLGDPSALRALAAGLDAGDEACRALYRALRSCAFRTLFEAARAADITVPQARTAMRAFCELGLIDYTEAPFAYTLRPPVKCRLGDSPLLHALRELAENEKEERA